MKLHFEGLELECTVLRPIASDQPYEAWMTCEVRVRVPNFSGSFRWQVMAGELASLADDLENASHHVGQPWVVRFSPAEPNVMLEFAFNEPGQIAGRYQFRGEETGLEPKLSGSFGADQSYLPGMLGELRSLLSEAGAAV